MTTTAAYLTKTRTSNRRVDVLAIVLQYILLPFGKSIKRYGAYALKEAGDMFEFLFVQIVLPLLWIGTVSGLCLCLLGLIVEFIGFPVFLLIGINLGIN